MTCRKAFEKQMDKEGVCPAMFMAFASGEYAGEYIDEEFNKKWELWQQAWKAGRAEMRKKK